MQFLWSPVLWLLPLVLLFVAFYAWLQTRRRKYALRYASLALVKPAMTSDARWRRYIPPALFFLALAWMIVALARPVYLVRTPRQEGTVILALDSSLSMRADDLKPSRFEAARAAARTFVEKRALGAQVGIVTFAGNAAIVQLPTENNRELNAAINTLFLQRGTAIGEGIVTSLDAIALAGRDGPAPQVTPSLDSEDLPLLQPVAPGTIIPAIIILLTDGQNRNGRDPIQAAQLAAERGVRVFTVGIGTEAGANIRPGFGGGATFGGNGFRAELDEETLRAIAEETGGEYFYAANATELDKIYNNLGLNLVFKLEKMELTVWLTALASLCLLGSLLLSLVWNPFH